MSQFGSQRPVAPKPLQINPTAHADENSSLGLIGDSEASASEHKIKTMGNVGTVRRSQYTRTPALTGKGACRVRSFHGRLSDQGLEYMDNQINEWIDAHPEVEVKFVTSAVGVFEGKMREPALIMNLWY